MLCGGKRLVAGLVGLVLWGSLVSLAGAAQRSCVSELPFDGWELLKGLQPAPAGTAPPLLGIYNEVIEDELILEVGNRGPWGIHPRFAYHVVGVLRTYVAPDYQTTILRIERRPGYPPEAITEMVSRYGEPWHQHSAVMAHQRLNALYQENGRIILTHVQNNVEFAKEHERLRRGFGEPMLQDMQALAALWLQESTYITVRERKTPQRNIRATLRIVAAPYERRVPKAAFARSEEIPDNYLIPGTLGRLHPHLNAYFDSRWHEYHAGFTSTLGAPSRLILENRLAVTLDRPALWLPNEGPFHVGVGVLFEPGIWAIHKDMNEVGFSETLLHLINGVIQVRDGVPLDFFLHGARLVTWADEVGEALYGHMGFQPTRHPKRWHGDRFWQAMEWHPAQMLSMMANLEKIRRGIDEPRAQQVRGAMRGLLEYYQQPLPARVIIPGSASKF